MSKIDVVEVTGVAVVEIVIKIPYFQSVLPDKCDHTVVDNGVENDNQVDAQT